MTRDANINVRARDRALARDLKRSEQKVARFGQKVTTSLRGAFKGGLATVGSFAAVGGLSSQLQEGMQYQTTLQRLGDQAKMSKTAIGTLDKEIRGQASAWGMTNNEMLQATSQLVNLQGAGALTGDNMAFLGEAMTATGASAANTARVMSALMDQGVKTPQEMRAAFDALIEAGDAGNIPFDLMANNLSSILPMVKGLVSEGKQGHAEVGGLLQVLGKVTGGDISQGQTLLKAMVNNLDQKKAELRKAGFKDLFDKKGNLRTLYEIRGRLGDLAKNKKLIKLITSSEARQALKAIGEYGTEWENITAAAKESNATQRKAQSFMASSAGKWRKALADIKNKFHEAMTPERIDQVADAAGHLVDVLGFASDHLSLLIGAWAAWKGLGLARYIGDVAGSMQKLGGVSAVAGKSLGVMGNIGKVGLLGAVGTATYAIGSYVDQVTGLSDKLAGIEPPRSNDEIGSDMERQAISTRDWLQGVHSGRIKANEKTRQLVAKRMRGDRLTDDERDQLSFESGWSGKGFGFVYDESKQNWDKALAESERFLIPERNKRVDAQNAQVRTKARELIDSGAAISTLQDMALRDNADGRIDTGMIINYMQEQGLNAHRRDFVRTGDPEVDARLAKHRADAERRSDAELVIMIVKAVESAKLQVKADVSLDRNRMVEELANAPTKNRSY